MGGVWKHDLVCAAELAIVVGLLTTWLTPVIAEAALSVVFSADALDGDRSGIFSKSSRNVGQIEFL